MACYDMLRQVCHGGWFLMYKQLLRQPLGKLPAMHAARRHSASTQTSRTCLPTHQLSPKPQVCHGGWLWGATSCCRILSWRRNCQQCVRQEDTALASRQAGHVRMGRLLSPKQRGSHARWLFCASMTGTAFCWRGAACGKKAWIT